VLGLYRDWEFPIPFFHGNLVGMGADIMQFGNGNCYVGIGGNGDQKHTSIGYKSHKLCYCGHLIRKPLDSIKNSMVMACERV